MPYGKTAGAGKSRRILKGREKLWVNPPSGGEGKALIRLALRANRPQTHNFISELLKISTSLIPVGTTLARVPEVIIVNGVCNLRSVRLKRKQLVELVEDTCALLGSLQEGAIGGKKVLLSGGLAVQSLHNGFFG